MKETGRQYLQTWLEGREVDPGVIEDAALSVQWSVERIALRDGKATLEIGPGDGDLLSLQLSRSAALGERGLIGRLFNQERPTERWLNVRLRGRGMDPIYLRAELPDDEQLIGLAVLPGVARTTSYDKLTDLLVACLALDVSVASWPWDDTVDMQVSDDLLDEVRQLLTEPCWAHWQMLCDWYDGLPPADAARVLPRLRTELRSWPDALREVEADLETVDLEWHLSEREHTHLDFSRVLRLLPDGITDFGPADLELLQATPRATELSSIVAYSTTDEVLRPHFLQELVESGNLDDLRELHLENFDFRNDATGFVSTDRPAALQRLRSLALVGCRLGSRHLSRLEGVARVGHLDGLQKLDLSGNRFDGESFIRLLNVLTGLKSVIVRHCGFDTASAVRVLNDPRIATLDEFRLTWVLHGREFVVALGGQSPLEQLDLSDRAVGEFADRFDLLACTPFETLKSLSLRNNKIGDGQIRRLIQATPDGLVELNLSHNPIADEGFHRLARNPKFKWLQHLDLSGTHISTPESRTRAETWMKEQPGLAIVLPAALRRYN